MLEPRPWPAFDVPSPPAADGTVLHSQDGWEWYADSAAARGVSVRQVVGGPAANEDTLRSRAESALATLEQAVANWDSLTAAQKDGALKLTVKATAGLIRLALRRFDSAGG